MSLLAKGLVQFSLLVAATALFFDLTLLHGLLWDNEVRIEYLLIHGFLIASVFLLGTTWLGLGGTQAVFLAGLSTLLLKAFYQWGAPPGIPHDAQWLGYDWPALATLAAHFLMVMLGYFLALWLWIRNDTERHIYHIDNHNFVSYTFLAAVLIVTIEWAVSIALIPQNPVQLIVPHLLAAFVFLSAWAAYGGFSRMAWIMGSLVLALLLVTYNRYLAPGEMPLMPTIHPDGRIVPMLQDIQPWWKPFTAALVGALAGWPLAGRIMKMRDDYKQKSPARETNWHGMRPNW